MSTIAWKSLGAHGASLQVATKLKWSEPSCRALYLHLNDKYDDQPILNCNGLYYDFGAIGNGGKAGFGISGHTKKRAAMNKGCKTFGVFHIEN